MIYSISQFKQMKHHQNFSKFRTALLSNVIRNQKIEEIVEASDLEITNVKSHYRLKYGQRFNDMIEARDQVLEHEFSFRFQVNSSEFLKEGDFLGGDIYLSLIEYIKEFLAESVGNVVSIAFNFLCKGDLLEKEAMEFACKNIILNVHSIFKHTIHSVKEHPILKEVVKVDELKGNLIYQIDIILKNILINLADSYPQAPASGGTIRMREAIAEVNRADDDEYDLIYANNIKIDKHLKLGTNEKGWEKIIFNQEGDYTEYIMEVLNAAVQIPQSSQGDSRERSTKETFTQFNEKLFWVCQQKKYQQLIHSIQEKKGDLGKTHSKNEGEKIKKAVCNFYREILESNEQKLQEIRLGHKIIMPRLGSKDHSGDNSFFYEQKKEISGDTALETLLELGALSDQGIQSLKKDKKYLIGQKIPPSVKSFGRQEMILKQFRAKHSSVFRILTKWAGYLQEIFLNSDKYVRQRVYPFKSIHNELVIVTSNNPGIEKLIQQLKREYLQVKKKFEALLKSSYELLGEQLGADHKSFVSFVTRFTETRTVSSKINAILTSLMLKYTNILIHHLLKAGQFIDTTRYKGINLNLVVFRVSDLLRSKFQCSESSFISLLKTMYILDNSEQMRGHFKLVRIKNKLDDSANNIMINYFFKGKVQSELQLSIQESHGKEKNYYTFSHFVYELTRGKFGVIADCAIMVSQLDPMISACKGNYYQEKTEQIPTIFKKESLEKQGMVQEQTPKEEKKEGMQKEKLNQTSIKAVKEEKTPEKQIKESIFECSKCSKLIINETNGIFNKEENQKICNECIIQSQEPQKLLREPFKSVIDKGRQDNWLKKIKNESELQNSEEKYYVSLNGGGILILNLIIKVGWQYKTFTFQITSKILQSLDSPNLYEDKIDYVDITKKIAKGKSSKHSELLYLVTSFQKASEEFMQLIKTDKTLLLQNEKKVIKWFQDFRLQKNLIKTIKFKAQVIKCNIDQNKWKSLEHVVTQLMLKQETSENSNLKYRKVEHLDGNNIKTLLANKNQIQKFPVWLQQFENLKILRMSNNKMTEIKKEELPPNLLELCISSNGLLSIDVSSLVHLTILELKFNQIQSIDLSNNTKLIELLLQSNKLSSIDVSRNTQLVNFQVNNNPLTTLDVSKNTSLQILYVYETSITSIDLSQNKKLQKIQLDNNKLTEIDLSQQKILKQLYIDHNKIKAIDLSQNTQITQVYVNHNEIETINVSQNIKITHFWVNSNKLTTLDVSKNVNVKQLRAQFNQLTSIDVTNSTKLEDLRLNTNKLTQIDVSHNPKLKQLYLYSNEITSIDLSSNNQITDLQINKNSIQQLANIPSSVITLYADEKAVKNFDFSQLPNLTKKKLE